MANGDIAADADGLTGISMQNGPILDIAALANHNRRHISPSDGRGPETGTGGEVDITDHHRRRRHPSLWVDARGGPGDLFGHEQQMHRALTIVGVRAG
jgi:hypothetical protein